MAKSKNDNTGKSKKKKDKKAKAAGLSSNAAETSNVDSKYYPKANPETVL